MSIGMIIVSVVGLISLLGGVYFFMIRKFYAELKDPSIHGRYVGINPIEVARGASFEDSKISFYVDGEGFRCDKRIHYNGTPLTFAIHFPAAWVFHFKGWGVEHCLSIRQDAQSDLAGMIFDFTKYKFGGQKMDGVVYLGEGILAVLGLFVREKVAGDSDVILKNIYDKVYTPSEDNAKEKSFLLEMDFVKDAETMATGYSENKILLLNRAGHNLWTGTDEEIAERLSFIEMGLNDADPEVQMQALETFTLGGRVIGGVDLVAGFFHENKTRLSNSVLKKTVCAAKCLLYEAYNYRRETTSILRDFGTLDLEKANKICNCVMPGQFEVLEKVANTERQRRWTIGRQITLRSILEEVIASEKTRGVNFEIINECKKALAEYPVLG